MLSFNPCFSGYWILTMSFENSNVLLIVNVSILVLVDIEFWPLQALQAYSYFLVSILVLVDIEFWHFQGCASSHLELVSILVLVDIEFWQRREGTFTLRDEGFNPCFSGYWILTVWIHRESGNHACFNPCFSGYWILTCKWSYSWWKSSMFQSLF